MPGIGVDLLSPFWPVLDKGDLPRLPRQHQTAHVNELSRHLKSHLCVNKISVARFLDAIIPQKPILPIDLRRADVLCDHDQKVPTKKVCDSVCHITFELELELIQIK